MFLMNVCPFATMLQIQVHHDTHDIMWFRDFFGPCHINDGEKFMMLHS